MKKITQLAEQIFVVLSLLHYSGGLLILLLSGGAGQADVEVSYDTTLIRAGYLLIYLITFIILVKNGAKTLYILTKDVFILSLIFIACFSVLWSYNLAITIKDSITLLGSSMFGYYFASRYKLREQLRLLAWQYGLVVVLSIAFALLIPKYGVMIGVGSGAWRGIFVHKNGLGSAMVMSAIVFIFLASGAKRNGWISWCFLSLSIMLLLLSQSASSLFNFSLLLAAFIFFRALRLNYNLMVLSITSTLLIGFLTSLWLFLNADSILGAFGRDLTLTGRTYIWAASFEMIEKHLLLGYGFGGFWNNWEGPSAYIWRTTGWTPTHPHNGLIALWLDLGLIGLSMFMFSFLKSVLGAIRYAQIEKNNIEGLWPITFLAYVVLVNSTETNLLISNRLVWVLYITLALSVSLSLRVMSIHNREALNSSLSHEK